MQFHCVQRLRSEHFIANIVQTFCENITHEVFVPACTCFVHVFYSPSDIYTRFIPKRARSHKMHSCILAFCGGAPVRRRTLKNATMTTTTTTTTMSTMMMTTTMTTKVREPCGGSWFDVKATHSAAVVSRSLTKSTH